jgi:ubiquitin carboxyl-terminal hydrolase 5/13
MLPLARRRKGSSSFTVPTQCTECDLNSNLWLCLTCGFANCGRKQFGGVGGNGHALEHWKDTGHPVGVKLGTITAEGTAGNSEALK